MLDVRDAAIARLTIENQELRERIDCLESLPDATAARHRALNLRSHMEHFLLALAQLEDCVAKVLKEDKSA